MPRQTWRHLSGRGGLSADGTTRRPTEAGRARRNPDRPRSAGAAYLTYSGQEICRLWQSVVSLATRPRRFKAILCDFFCDDFEELLGSRLDSDKSHVKP